MIKNYIRLLAIFILLPTISHAQWLPSIYDVQRSYCRSASFLSNDTFIVNLEGLLLRTQNGGLEFDTLKNFPPEDAYNMAYKSIDTLFVARENTKGLLKSVDAGQTWNVQTLLMPNGDTAFKDTKIVYFGFFDASHGIVFGDTVNGVQQVFLSDDGGVNWYFYTHPSITQAIQFSLAYRAYSTDNKCIFESGDAKFLVGDARFLSLSAYGRIWQTDTTIANGLNITKIAFKDELNGLARITVPDTGGVPYKTSDGGKTWNRVHDSIFRVGNNLSYVKGTPQKPGFYYSQEVGKSRGNKVSYDDGLNWVSFDTLNSSGVFFRNAEAGICSDIGFMTAKLYYYSSHSVGLKEAYPRSIYELKCYPNPAQSSISFLQTFKLVQVWDLQGKLIASDTKVNKLDISNIPNGMYLVKTIDENGIVATQKLLIQH